MLTRAFLLLGAVVIVLLGVITTRPDSYRLERSIVIPTPPEAPFSLVNDFHGWQRWSPWDKLDPTQTRTYGGSPSGAGATYAWAGNDKVGAGQMAILQSEVPQKIVIRLDFLKPRAQTSTTTFQFVPLTEGTQVTWAMEGHADFVGKAFSMVFNMDQMVGPSFEEGLAKLKAAAVELHKEKAEAAAALAAQAASAPPAPPAPAAAANPMAAPPPAQAH